MTNLKKMQDVDFTGKYVLVRVDFNISLDGSGDVVDDYKIRAASETVEYLCEHGAKVALVSHLGRPKDKEDSQFAMAQLRDDVARVFSRSVRLACDCVGVCVSGALEKLADGEVLLLENVRYHKQEKENNTSFARQMAAPFDIYINEAFGVCHRAHASVHAITKHIPSYAGLWLQREVEMLSEVKGEVEDPSVAIIGGAKIETKIPLIESFEKIYTDILVGGRTSVEAIDRGMTFSSKVVLPSDFAENGYDIGEETTAQFVKVISAAKTIVWNGPLGKFEEPPYDLSTRAVAEAISANKEAFSVVGGGESVQALVGTDHFDDVTFVSTGGGAMLSFLSDGEMPALRVLEN